MTLSSYSSLSPFFVFIPPSLSLSLSASLSVSLSLFVSLFLPLPLSPSLCLSPPSPLSYLIHSTMHALPSWDGHCHLRPSLFHYLQQQTGQKSKRRMETCKHRVAKGMEEKVQRETGREREGRREKECREGREKVRDLERERGLEKTRRCKNRRRDRDRLLMAHWYFHIYSPSLEKPIA